RNSSLVAQDFKASKCTVERYPERVWVNAWSAERTPSPTGREPHLGHRRRWLLSRLSPHRLPRPFLHSATHAAMRLSPPPDMPHSTASTELEGPRGRYGGRQEDRGRYRVRGDAAVSDRDPL